MDSYKRLHDLGAVGVESVPDDDQWLADPAPEVAQSGDDLLAVDTAAEVAGVQPRRPSQRRDQGDDAGDLASLAEPSQDWRPAAARPGGAEAGPKHVTRLVHEGNGAPCSASPIFTRGQSRLSHASMRASSCSRARAIGCCRMKPCARTARPSERKWYCTPKVRSTTAAIRRKVQRSVSKPAARAPRSRILPSCCRWAALSREARPAGARRRRLASPASASRCFQRLTDTRLAGDLGLGSFSRTLDEREHNGQSCRDVGQGLG